MENLTTTMELQEVKVFGENLTKDGYQINRYRITDEELEYNKLLFKMDIHKSIHLGCEQRGDMVIVSDYWLAKSLVSYNGNNYVINGDVRTVLEIIFDSDELLFEGFKTPRSFTKNNETYSTITYGYRKFLTVEESSINEKELFTQLYSKTLWEHREINWEGIPFAKILREERRLKLTK
jgi:hypothetical protein